MARLNRLCPVGIPPHIIQRGNNRQVCFNGDEDGWKTKEKFTLTRMALT